MFVFLNDDEDVCDFLNVDQCRDTSGRFTNQLPLNKIVWCPTTIAASENHILVLLFLGFFYKEIPRQLQLQKTKYWF